MAVHPFNYEASLAACARGEEHALQELFRHESPHMLALCTEMMGNPHDAQEAVRDAFVLVWNNADNYDPGVGTARAWIYSIMRYRVLNRLRQSGRPATTHSDPTQHTNKPDAVSTDPAALAVTQCVAQMDETQRRPILMAFYNGLTYEQIAPRVGIPVAQLKTQVRTGLHALQDAKPA